MTFTFGQRKPPKELLYCTIFQIEKLVLKILDSLIHANFAGNYLLFHLKFANHLTFTGVEKIK